MKRLLLLLLLPALPAWAETGFLVAAPDRGFVGNEETRTAFAELAARHPAELVFITDQRSGEYFRGAVRALEEEGADDIVLLPFYLSSHHPDMALLRELAAAAASPVRLGRPFGESHLAVRLLAERLAVVPEDARRLVIAGHGVRNAADEAAMRADLERLAAAAADRYAFEHMEVLMTREDDDLKARLDALPAGSVVLPFHLAAKYDAMMSHSAWLEYAAPEGVRVLEGGVTPHPAVGAWLLREAARHLPLDPRKVGVVVHAHGADFHWNERMRQAAAPLGEDYLVEYAFSMADPDTLRQAVEKLAARGAKAVVIVRVFGMANSFRDRIERFIGADYERCEATEPGDHGHHGNPPPRLLTPLPVVTVGGLEDHPLFARALLERARSLSREPARETVILVAHGKGSDEQNAAWLRLLDSLREQMLAMGGDGFRAIEIGTWREDWPDKRDAAVARIRGLIEKARENNGRAILVPARTNAQGPARELIPDLDYALGEGFAPHPLFVEWLREQVREGMRLLSWDTASRSCAPQIP